MHSTICCFTYSNQFSFISCIRIAIACRYWIGTRILLICIIYEQIASRNGLQKWNWRQNKMRMGMSVRILMKSELVCLVSTANVLVRDQSERQKLSRSNMHITNKSDYSATRHNAIQQERILLQFFFFEF